MVQVGAELVKIALSKDEETEFFCLLPASTGLDDLEVLIKITRKDLELVCKPLLDRTIFPITDVLSNAGMKVGEIDELVMVGGSSRIPWVRDKLEEMFEKEPNDHIDPDIAVAYGATTVAH
jgi:molecular chaperone DnaK